MNKGSWMKLLKELNIKMKILNESETIEYIKKKNWVFLLIGMQNQVSVSRNKKLFVFYGLRPPTISFHPQKRLYPCLFFLVFVGFHIW